MPSPGISYDFLRPIPFLRFTKEDINSPFKGEHVARDSSWGRGAWNPFDDLVFATKAEIEVRDAAAELNAELEFCFGQKNSDVRQWPADYVPERWASDPLENERNSRKLQIFALNYLADKGFLVLDLLLEYGGPTHTRISAAPRRCVLFVCAFCQLLFVSTCIVVCLLFGRGSVQATNPVQKAGGPHNHRALRWSGSRTGKNTRGAQHAAWA